MTNATDNLKPTTRALIAGKYRPAKPNFTPEEYYAMSDFGYHEDVRMVRRQRHHYAAFLKKERQTWLRQGQRYSQRRARQLATHAQPSA